MTGPELRKLRCALGLSVEEFARALHVAAVTVYRWEGVAGEVNATGIVGEILRHMPPPRVCEVAGALIRRCLIDSGGTLGAFDVLLQIARGRSPQL